MISVMDSFNLSDQSVSWIDLMKKCVRFYNCTTIMSLIGTRPMLMSVQCVIDWHYLSY